MIYVTPAAGLKVPDPAQLEMPDRHLPVEGRFVEPSGYWQRRVNDGDVTLGEPKSTPAPVMAAVDTTSFKETQA